MHCHVCNVAVGDGQSFCHACGQSLAGVTDPTQPLQAVASTDDTPPKIVAPGDDERVALPSEHVDAPNIAEPDSTDHAGALPDLAQAPPTDDEWQARLAAAPPPAMPQPPTQPIEAVPDAMPPPEMPAPLADSASFIEPESTQTPYDTDLNDLVDATPATGALPVTEAVGTSPVAEGITTDQLGASPEAGMHTAQMPAVFDGASDVVPAAPLLQEPEGFRLRAAFVFAVLAVLTVLLTSVADVIDVRTTRPVDGISVGIRMLDDFGTNLAVAGFVAAALMLLGGLLSCFGLRWGAGLAGGGGLSLVGWAAMTLALIEVPIHDAQSVTRAATNEVSPFTLSVTRDLGWFLIIAAAALGMIVFLVSLRMAGTGGRRGLNPWIAAVGALTMVVVAAGPLITLDGAALDANLAVDGLPRLFFAGRLIQVALIVVTGVFGFLAVRNYGLGFAAGGLGAAVWLWVSSLIELGDSPVSIAVGNIGTAETTPHMVTTVGIAAALVMLVVGAAASFAARHRP